LQLQETRVAQSNDARIHSLVRGRVNMDGYGLGFRLSIRLFDVWSEFRDKPRHPFGSDIKEHGRSITEHDRQTAWIEHDRQWALRNSLSADDISDVDSFSQIHRTDGELRLVEHVDRFGDCVFDCLHITNQLS
jgi:hypothetical protein